MRPAIAWEATIARRDLIIAWLDKRIVELGKAKVLYLGRKTVRTRWRNPSGSSLNSSRP